MGFIKQTKVDHVADDARRAYATGQTVFAPRLNTPMITMGMSGEIKGWGEMIQAVEQAGWTLTHWAASVDKQGKPEAYPLFRRAA